MVSDSIGFNVSNGTSTSSDATISITVVGTPTATGQSVNVAENSVNNNITVIGSDPNSPPKALVYSITVPTAHGTLVTSSPSALAPLGAPSLHHKYTPNAGYFGPDSFQFTDTNGTAVSAAATVSITVVGTPTASSQSVTCAENSVNDSITLTGSDPNTPALPLTYTVTVNPSHGELSGNAPNLTYTPSAGYVGPDSFNFNVIIATATSSVATVTLDVATTSPPPPAPPVPSVPSPIISPSGGVHTTSATVTLTDSLGAAVIYYTTNGSTPTPRFSRYIAPFTVATSEIVEAIAYAQGYTNSSVASASFTIVPPTAPIPTISPNGGTFTSPQSVTITDLLGGAIIHYTTNGTMPTASSAVYSNPLTVSANETIVAIAIATGYGNSPPASAPFVIAPFVPTPAISPNGGTFTGAQFVTITDVLSGSTIYYTTDGTAPTVSSARYSGPINVSYDQTIQAIATALGLTPSPAASAMFTIALPAPTPADQSIWRLVYGATAGYDYRYSCRGFNLLHSGRDTAND